MRPPDDLKSWKKNDLIRELRRLRAIMREHAERPGTDPRQQAATDPIIDMAGDPDAAHGVLLDMRSAVLMETVEVALVDTFYENDRVAMMMTIGGRINYSDDTVVHAYVGGPDGAAALVAELVALAHRASKHPGDGQRWAAEFRLGIESRSE